jgi:predicted ATP-binding protein involved in virulence
MPTDTKAPDAMHFRSLCLENVRAFGKSQSLDLFDNDGNISRWNLILGENGVGKTTLLETLMVMRPVPASIEKSGAAGTPTLSIARISEFENKEIMRFIRRGESNSTAMTAVLETADGASVKVRVEIKGSANDLEEVKFPEEHYALRSDGPLVIRYVAGRHLGNRNLGRIADRDATASPFSEVIELYDAEEILEKLDHAAKTHDDENDIEVRRFNKLKAVAASILPGLRTEDIEVRGPRIEGRDRDLSGVHVRTPSGVVPLEELSLGYRTMFALIVDLTWRLSNAFPESLEPVHESAIVLIDEIDLHLHPRWQREIARRLMSQFPNIQFIATTHSPVTAQETLSEGGNVAVVRWEDGEAHILNRPVPPGNWRFDQVLTDELFPGIASDRPQKVEAKLYERLELIRNSNRSVEQETRLRELDEFVASLPTARTPSDQSFEELMMNIAKDFPSGVAR